MSRIIGSCLLNLKYNIHVPTRTFQAVKSIHKGKSDSKDNSNIVYSPLSKVNIASSTIPERVFQSFGKYPKKIAVECMLTGKKYTYEELRIKSRNFGSALRIKLKLKKGDAVTLLLPNVPDFPIALLGALDAGLIVTTVNPQYTPDEIKRQLLDSNTKVLITLGQLWKTAEAATKLLPNPVPIIAVKTNAFEVLPRDAINFQELSDVYHERSNFEKIDEDDTAILLYTSGTTGTPKGVQLSSKNVVANLQQMNDLWIRLGSPTTETHQEIVPGLLPWFHIYGLVLILLHCLQNLYKLVALSKFSPVNFVNLLEKHEPTILYTVPPIVGYIINNPEVQKKHLQSLHTVFCAAAPLGALDEEKLKNKADNELSVVQGYGLTETCGALILPSKIHKKLGAIGSVGLPLANTSIKVLPVDSPYGKPLAANQPGEIYIKGPQVTKGYHNTPEETKQALLHGWFRTGDVGYYDDNKLFYITDRVKQLIKVNGFQVAPSELEEIIRNYPGVSEVGVIGIPHAVYGEVPRAYIVLKKNLEVDPEKLMAYVANKVSNIKNLRGGVAIIDNLPKNASGKTLKKELQILYKNEAKI